VSSTDVYRLAISTGYKVLVFATMIGFSLVGLTMIVLALRSHDPGMFPFAVVFCAALVWNWHVLLGIPYEIRFEGPGQISFVALRRTTRVSADELHSIKPYRGGGGLYVIRHERGKIRLLAQITGLHEVISRIKTANPNFEVVGI
jgi:hypothetical protein